MSSTCSHIRELRPTSGCDRSGSLRHPSKFQRVSRLCSVTARHSSIWRQPNFAVLNRGGHLYSAGRPSRWALGHILVCILLRRLNAGRIRCSSSVYFFQRAEITINHGARFFRTIKYISQEKHLESTFCWNATVGMRGFGGGGLYSSLFATQS